MLAGAALVLVAAAGCTSHVDGVPIGMSLLGEPPATTTTTAPDAPVAPAPQPDPTVQDSTSSPYPGLTTGQIDETFLGVVRQQTDEFAGDSDGFLIAGAHANCELLRSGTSLAVLVDSWMQQGYSGTAAGTLIGAGTVAYCPDMEMAVR